MVQWSLNASSSSLPSGLTKCNVISQLSPHAHPAYTSLDLYENNLVVWWYHQIQNGDQLSLGLFGPMITQCFFLFSPLWLDKMQRYITAFTSCTPSLHHLGLLWKSFGSMTIRETKFNFASHLWRLVFRKASLQGFETQQALSSITSGFTKCNIISQL